MTCPTTAAAAAALACPSMRATDAKDVCVEERDGTEPRFVQGNLRVCAIVDVLHSALKGDTCRRQTHRAACYLRLNARIRICIFNARSLSVSLSAKVGSWHGIPCAHRLGACQFAVIFLQRWNTDGLDPNDHHWLHFLSFMNTLSWRIGPYLSMSMGRAYSLRFTFP